MQVRVSIRCPNYRGGLTESLHIRRCRLIELFWGQRDLMVEKEGSRRAEARVVRTNSSSGDLFSIKRVVEMAVPAAWIGGMCFQLF